ncbi:CHASE2 domain-containing protein [Nostoc sp. ATCC 53789]|uniref:CHASE2 domain-containing protein n=1 Tax=Nostoc sp. ATCC 53789 TaxID=76335 RepID=UPI000DEC3344|nr:CHASE2 domain-containing protein [Nostoc sp. ATCC 53789]QHG14813.1 CHASE2 domain-containing protein [Nostoc sp. ATCC 53789]RCJ26819.1 transmembrane sensor domain protein [Nostoc sp. ATCC 53789]
MWQKLKKSLKKWQGTLIITPCVAGLVIAGSNIGVFRILEWVTLDQLFRIRPQEAIDKRIVIVTIDEPDIQYVKQWPMSDRVMAKMIHNIKAQQPRAIAIDIYRDLPVEPGHAELVKEFQNTPNFIGIEKVAGKPVAPPPILAKQSQVAANDLLLDTDGKIRRGIILLGKPDQSLAQGLGVKLALIYLEKAGIELKSINADKQIYGLGKAKFVPLSSNDGQYNEADMGGYQVLINYRGGLESFPHISMTDVLENRIPANFIRDRLVLIGAKAPSLNDSYSTPYNSNLFFPTELVPGVVVHANLTSQILSAAIDGRPMMRAIVKPLNWFLIIFWSGYSATFGTIYIKKRWLTIGGLLLAVVIIFSSAYIAFLGGWLIPVFTPLLTVISALIIGLVQVLWKNLMLSYRQLEDYAHNLEIKVQERTAELAEANEEINILNEKLKGENLRMSAELDIIRRMQQMILPKPEELEAIEGLDIAGFMEAADEVGGDYYDVLHTDGVVTLGIGDVTGHGLESGLLMLMTQTAVRLLKEIRESDSVRFFDTLNRTICKNVQRMNSEKNLTLVILNYAQGQISISGQHEETIIIRKGGQIELIDTMDLGFPIGLDDDITDFISDITLELQPGDGVVLYTDGITEAKDINKNQYGLEPLCEIISHNWHKSASEIKDAVILDVRRHIGKQKVFDDITLLVFKRQEEVSES